MLAGLTGMGKISSTHNSTSAAKHAHRHVFAFTTMLVACAMATILLDGCAGPSVNTPHATATIPAGPILVGANIDVSQAPYSQDEVSAAIDPTDPSTILAGSNSLQYSTSVRVYGSGDGGKTWSSDLMPLPRTVVRPGAVDQWVAIGPNHEQAMSFLAFGNPSTATLAGLALYVATRTGPSAAWQPSATPVDGLPAAGAYDDKDMLTVDNNPSSPYYGRWYVGWTRWSPAGTTPQGTLYGGVLLVSYSTDGGHTWSSSRTLRGAGSNWGAYLVVSTEGAVTASWDGDGHMWIAQSHDGGQHFSPATAFGDCVPPVSDCVDARNVPAQSDAGVRSNPALVYVPATSGQPAQVLAFYANGDGGTHTIIDMARIDATTLKLVGTPIAVPLGASDTDQFLPAAAYDPSNHALWVCAYVTLPTDATKTRYTCTASQDGGAHFLPATPVASVSSDEEGPEAYSGFIGRQYGDYTALVAANGTAHAFWTDSRDLATRGEEIYTTTLRLNSTSNGGG